MSKVTVNVNGTDYEVDGDAMLVHALREEIGALGRSRSAATSSTCGTHGHRRRAAGRRATGRRRPSSGEGALRRGPVRPGGRLHPCVCRDRRRAVRRLHAGDGHGEQALLDKTPDPTRDDVAKAIRTDICRCTGYRQIVDAVLLSGESSVPARPLARGCRAGCGCPTPRHRPDTDEKVRHRQVRRRHPAARHGLRQGAALADPRGLVKSLGLDAKAPDCLAILTSEDVPENKIGHITPGLGCPHPRRQPHAVCR